MPVYSFRTASGRVVKFKVPARSNPSRKRTAKKSSKRKTSKRSTAKRKPAAKKTKTIAVPKGKKKGDIFTRQGKRYQVVSYLTKAGKRVRYAKRV